MRQDIDGSSANHKRLEQKHHKFKHLESLILILIVGKSQSAAMAPKSNRMRDLRSCNGFSINPQLSSNQTGTWQKRGTTHCPQRQVLFSSILFVFHSRLPVAPRPHLKVVSGKWQSVLFNLKCSVQCAVPRVIPACKKNNSK